ncbi:TolC family protein [Desulfogranum mediterraneum]|uniref:TolC family protein n=1 Tax=Desulfogranum mediterraneum TaxID=160661 RepID=UPI00048C594B|nr:TolC family protein [Desulfogranum mediterraneum]
MKRCIWMVIGCLALTGAEAQAQQAGTAHPAQPTVAELALVTESESASGPVNGAGSVLAELARIEVLDLRTAQQLALIGNPDLVAAQARVEQARMRVKQAVAAWWPTVDLSAVGARERLSDSVYELNQMQAAVVNGEAERTTDKFSVGIQATWLLFDGFFRSFKEEQAGYDQASNAASLLNSRRLLVTAVAEAFYNAQLAQTRVNIAQADKAFYLRQLEDAQNRYEVGAGAWGDVLNIKVQLNSAQTSLLVNQREFEAAGYGLAALLGLSDATFPETVRLQPLDRNFVLQPFQEEIEPLIEQALVSRPDVEQLELVVKQAEAGTGLAKAPFYPKVQLNGAVNGARQGDIGLTDDDLGNTVSVNLAWNLFAGGGDKARLAEARQLKRESRYSLFNLRNQVASEIRKDIALLEAAEDQVRLQRESVGLVEENRDLAKNEYEAGEASLVRLNEAQRDLTATYSRLAQALVGYHLAKQRLDGALGRNLAGFMLEEAEQ